MGSDNSDSVNVDMSMFEKGAASLNTTFQTIQAKLQLSVTAVESWNQSTDSLKGRIESLNLGISAESTKLTALNQVFANTANMQETGSNAIAKLTSQLDIYQKSVAASRITLSDFKETQRSVGDGQNENHSVLSKLSNVYSNFGEKTKFVSAGIKNYFSGSLSSVKSYTGQLEDSFKPENMIKNAEADEEAVNKIGDAIKKAGGASDFTKKSAIGLAESLSKVTMFSKDTVLSTESMLMTYSNLGKNVMPKATEAVLNMSTSMGQDTKKSAQQLGQALSDPIKGISQLEGIGVKFTQSQKDQIASMQKAGNTAGAQQVILQALNKEYGNSARAAGTTLPGQLKIAKNSFDQMGAQIGIALLPAIKSILPQLLKLANDLAKAVVAHKSDIQNAVNNISGVISKVFNFISTHGPLVKGIIIGVGSAFAAIKIGGGIVSGINGVAKACENVNKIGKQLNITMDENPIGIIITLVGMLILTFIKLFNNCKPFHDWVINAFNSVKSVASTVINAVVGFFRSAIDIIKSVWSGITGFFSGIWNGISKVFSGIGGWFENVFGGAVSGIKTAFNGITKFFSGIWDGIVDGVKNAVNFVIGALDKIHFTVPSWVPIIGGSSFGFNIPKLAEGGIVDKATLAVIGEAGKEAVMPLENNTGWIKQFAASLVQELGTMTNNLRSKISLTPQLLSAPALAGATGFNASKNFNIDVKMYFSGVTPQQVGNQQSIVRQVSNQIALEVARRR